MNDPRDESSRGPRTPSPLLHGLPEAERTLLIVDDDQPLCQRLGRAPLVRERLLIDVQGDPGVRMPKHFLGDLHIDATLPEELRETVAE